MDYHCKQRTHTSGLPLQAEERGLQGLLRAAFPLERKKEGKKERKKERKKEVALSTEHFLTFFEENLLFGKTPIKL